MKRILYLLLVITFVAAMNELLLAQSTYSEDFDTADNWSGSFSSYAGDAFYTNNVDDPSGDSFTFGTGLRETAGQGGTNSGDYAIRLDDLSSAYFLYECDVDVTSFTIWLAHWDVSDAMTVTIEYSTNSGTGFTEITTLDETWWTGSGLGDKDYKQFSSGSLNISPGSGETIQIKIRTDGNERLMLDDFELTYVSSGGNNPPVISNIIQDPSGGITSSTTVSVSADVTDTDGTITNVELHWGIATGSLGNTIPMSLNTGDTYTTNSDIPAQSDGTTVFYEIEATDDDTDVTTSSEQSYLVSDAATTTLPYSEPFDADLGDCYTYSVSGATKEWVWNSEGNAQMNGYNSGDTEEDWLILPGIDMDSYSNEVMLFDTWYRFGTDDINNYFKLQYSTNYTGTGDPTSATWTELAFTKPSAQEVWTSSGVVDLSGISGTSVYIAFKYRYESGSYRWWKVDNISIYEATTAIEPTNHPTGFSATANYSNIITVSWTDSDADHYLIKGSDVSFAAIVDPVDGTPEADGLLVQNIDAGIETARFVGLTPSTQYFFKIFGYNGTEASVNYKITGAPQDDVTTLDLPSLPDLVFTEVMQNPSAVSDGDGEWFEVYNPGAADVDIEGYYIGDLGSDFEIIDNGAPLIVPAEDYIVFSNNSDNLTNGGVDVDYQYSGFFFLSNSGDELVLWLPDGTTVVDQIAWDGGPIWPDPTGASMTLNPAKLNTTDNDDGTNWYEGRTPYGDGDLGTPGAPNDFPLTTWTGGTSTVWNETGNWSDGIPDENTDAEIPDVSGSKAPFPVISGSAAVMNLTMLSGSTLEVASTGELSVNGTFTNNGTLNIKSGSGPDPFAANLGSVIEYSGVNANVERYLVQNRWHSVASPVTSATANTFFDIYLIYYDEPTSQWVYITDPAQGLTPGVGYSAWSSDTYLGTTTVTYSGPLNTGSVPTALTNSGDRWNLAGNSYPSAVDWAHPSWTKNEIDAAVYVYANGDYYEYVPSTGVGSLKDGIIPAQTSFFVRVSDGATSPALQAENEARVHGQFEEASIGITKSAKSSEFISLEVKGNDFTDQAFVAIHPQATTEYDGQYDAFKRMGSEEAPQLYVVTPAGENLAINAIPQMETEKAIPLNLKVGTDGVYEISLDEVSGFDNVPVYLEDLQENKVVNLKSVSAYKFFANKDDAPGRFLLRFTGNEMPGQEQGSAYDGLFVYSKEKMVVVESDNALTGEIKVFNMLGKEIITEKIVNKTYFELELNDQKGIYIVNVISEQGMYNQKIYLNK